MKYSMDVYYTVLHFLRDFFVDREYPISFDEFHGIYDCDAVDLSTSYISTHEKSYKLSGIEEGDKITFFVSHGRNYDTCDKFEINVCCSDTFDSSDISVLFSESLYGEPVKKSVDSFSNVSFEADKIVAIDYLLKETATSLDKKNKFLSNLGSITLKFNKNFDYIYVSDLLFRTLEYQKSLEEIDYHIMDSINYIKSRICKNDIPDELEYLIPKGAAAYTWISWWEAEGRVMNNGTNKAENYYDRLMSEVDAVIDKWLDQQVLSEPDDINTDLIGFVEVNRYGKKKCFSRNTRRFSKRIDKTRYL